MREDESVFRASDGATVGAELELQLLDAKSLELADGILPLLTLWPQSEHVKPEMVQNTVELVSPVCASIDELEARLLAIAAEVMARCRTLGMSLCGAGAHPFSQRLALVTPLPRYRAIEQEAGQLARTQITFATHVHIGMASGDEAIAVMRGLKPFLPLLIALSASSPFWRGYDTGYAAYRHRILAATRSYGMPPAFGSWDEFCQFMAIARRAGVFENIDAIHWDLRPRPLIGTLEVRVLDAQPTVREAADLASLLRVLVHYLKSRSAATPEASLPQPVSWWLEKENLFQASRLGFDAVCVTDEQGTVRPMAELWREAEAALRPVAEEIGEAERLEELRQRVPGALSYARQRAVHARDSSLQAVAAALVGELEHEIEQSTQKGLSRES
jgi:glutamate---cysteine ligase / carboxylate-amine ligase